MKLPLTISDFIAVYKNGAEPEVIIRSFWERLSKMGAGPSGDPALIYIPPWDEISLQLQNLKEIDKSQAPLYGIPFVVKDNIDVRGWPTTAACPSFAYSAEVTAQVVTKLQLAGAIVLAKTNLDQFATGLVGTRSPFGIVKNPFDDAYICGGSSSGSASLVSRGLACFSLGTDTAGSGRIPAGFCNLVGTKPTPGLVSTRGVVPACKTLDCVSFFTLCVQDARVVLSVAMSDLKEQEQEPRFSCPTIFPRWAPSSEVTVGIPQNPLLFSSSYKEAFMRAVDNVEALGWRAIPIDMTPLFEIAKELYDGPWVAERYAAIEEHIHSSPSSIDSNVLSVINKSKAFSAVQAFKSLYEIKFRAVEANAIFQSIDALLVPTAPEHPTIQDIQNDPIGRNASLGTYTNFVNLLGWSALALPSGFTEEEKPFGVTLIAPGGHDFSLLELGELWHRNCRLPLGSNLRLFTDPDWAPKQARSHSDGIRIAVVGAHLEGMPLHWQIKKAGASLLRKTFTSKCYGLFSLQNSIPPKPGLKRVTAGGDEIEVEVYDFPLSSVGEFLSQIPHPLGLGTIELCDGSWVKGFICEPIALEQAKDITSFKGWRAFCSSTI